MRIALFALVILALTADVSMAGPFRRSRRTSTPVNNGYVSKPKYPVASSLFRTAQHVAAHMAKIGRIGHFGGNSGYEGCGMGSTPKAAEMNCCYRHQMTPREVGVAQGPNGMWYACCRY